MAKKGSKLTEWLLSTAGPIVRYRTAVELVDNCPPREKRRLLAELLKCAEVKRWLARLGKGPLHHSKDTAFENAAGKLLEYGLRAGIPAFDRKMRPYCRRAAAKHSSGTAIALPFLVRAGYAKHEHVAREFRGRLAALRRTARAKRYDFYMSKSQVREIPESQLRLARGRFYRPEFNPVGDECPLPTCYDLLALLYWPRSDKRTWRAIEEVIRYVIDRRFQKTPGGSIWDPVKSQRWAAGRVYLACLPGFLNVRRQEWGPGRFVLFMEAAASSPTARRSAWFRRGLRHLESFRTGAGTYRFPGNYLLERAGSYYLYAGAHMGLGESRRERTALEVESTFRMLRIRKSAGER
jgi:hypothetical protein